MRTRTNSASAPVRILEIDGARVRVDALEAIDGTPVVDVKPALRPR